MIAVTTARLDVIIFDLSLAEPEPPLPGEVLAIAKELRAFRSAALSDIAAERHRQGDVEGFTDDHDDAHVLGQLARAAACYAWFGSLPAGDRSTVTTKPDSHLAWWRRSIWPSTWAEYWWKPKTRREDLVRAGALIVAEIERLDRKAVRGESTR